MHGRSGDQLIHFLSTRPSPVYGYGWARDLLFACLTDAPEAFFHDTTIPRITARVFLGVLAVGWNMGGGFRSRSGSESRFAGTGADTIGEGDMRALTLVG